MPVLNRRRPLLPHISGATSLLQTPLKPSGHFTFCPNMPTDTREIGVVNLPSADRRGGESPGYRGLEKQRLGPGGSGSRRWLAYQIVSSTPKQMGILVKTGNFTSLPNHEKSFRLRHESR